ncbi:P-loop containing nucleoside triphosphate hydrolase protein [Pelagophyceae sp. CCMP2097]|nr:P-loop containing nucleoside triphosphate hydrolase protein [Pelagophyceae sp. CCMP2097]
MPPRRRKEALTEGEAAIEAASTVSERAAARLTALQSSGEGLGEYDFSCDGSLRDFSGLFLKQDHANRPLWVCPDGTIFLEASSPLYLSAYDFVVAIAEPVARPEFVHQYTLTPYSLYAAVSVGIAAADIVGVLDKLSKVAVPRSVAAFIKDSTKNYGRAKLVLRGNRHFVESEDAEALRELLQHEDIKRARDVDQERRDAASVAGASDAVTDEHGFAVGEAQSEMAANRAYLALARELDGDDDDDDDGAAEAAAGPDDSVAAAVTRRTLSFALAAGAAALVKRVAAKELDFPLVEEYDFRRDTANAVLPIELRPSTRIRGYQEKSLSKMFGNGRARSGIIVLPCGAGKTLTAIVAAATVKRSTLVLCTNATAVAQWKAQFLMWTSVDPVRVSLFTADVKEPLHAECGILVTTYHMVCYSGRRSAEGQRLIEAVQGREWGLMLLDEVHVVPAVTFRRVLAVCNAHCKLGLTATLVREDDLITDLNFLIGPKLYEANWMDLTHAGHLANVQCVEVWCEMAAPFYREYLRAGGVVRTAAKKGAEDGDDAPEAAPVKGRTHADLRRQRLLYVLNPVKFRAAEYLVKYHEARGDKVILFSDDVYALLQYAKALQRPAIYGATKESERQAILGSFRFNAVVNTVCLSKVGDVAIDLPEANVIVQVSSHFGSRRQEAQRLGRILRAKPGADGDGFNAFFYTLVSTDTSEMFYSAKRQQYLVDQGYTFKVVNDLPDADDSVLATKESELELLTNILSAEYLSEEEAEENALKRAAMDDVGQDLPKRSLVTMSKLSGADGARYLEFDASNPAGQAKQGPKRHKLFKARKTPP